MRFAFRLLFLLSTAVAFTSVHPLFASSLSSGLPSSSLPSSRPVLQSRNRLQHVPNAGAFATSSSQQRGLRSKAGQHSPQSSLSSSVRGGVSSAVANTGGGTATMSNEVFNLVKNIVGAGVLSLPAGVAAFGDHPSALIPGTALIVMLGLLSAYCFSMIGRVCAMTGARSFRGAWDKSVGPSTSWIPAATCTFKTGVANVAYSMILADTFQALASTAGYDVSRTATLLGITGTVLLPLCLMRDLKSLAPFSLLGIGGTNCEIR